jgi:hypothetical protein
LVRYQTENDQKSFETALKDGITHARATVYKHNEAVYVEKIDSDLVQLKRIGETRSYWTDLKTIRKL